jgi:hypothetical protein
MNEVTVSVTVPSARFSVPVTKVDANCAVLCGLAPVAPRGWIVTEILYNVYVLSLVYTIKVFVITAGILHR